MFLPCNSSNRSADRPRRLRWWRMAEVQTSALSL
ncbi:hypothetical protein RHOER0001_4909 [Rhodococcus erythropolis SK121]|nr:hypothetical protein RHOER0001_4909 [Rhodococcus erythropolis SK121]